MNAIQFFDHTDFLKHTMPAIQLSSRNIEDTVSIQYIQLFKTYSRAVYGLLAQDYRRRKPKTIHLPFHGRPRRRKRKEEEEALLMEPWKAEQCHAKKVASKAMSVEQACIALLQGDICALSLSFSLPLSPVV